ncbi:rhomboid family intramembrane serine protease [Ancylomarina euxinus]|uniref:Rhomboid family intramembrane serine protease n=1 Tax=Ancylomarina euxinus TaxID=2283627 RepID=A0A425XWM9_9BACT|nr:rhomboid family intramembrane serine protease [Ancylomarina euxinus]RRG19045.1 rhomboid family intramembrane serine protease [Ancylomarina euxinus]
MDSLSKFRRIRLKQLLTLLNQKLLINEKPYDNKLQEIRSKQSLIFPVAFVSLIWLIKTLEWGLDLDFYQLGIFPLQSKGLLGIITSPLIHSDFEHLIANTIPIFALSWGIFYFYRPLAFRIVLYCLFTTNILLWLGGREAWHIGASGLVYAFASFLFFSGLFRNYYKLIAISFVVAFLYGGLFWGIFPVLKDVSWEGHGLATKMWTIS